MMRLPPRSTLFPYTALFRFMVTLPQVSLAVGASNVQALVHSTVLLDTQAMVGGVGTSPVTIPLQSAVLPPASASRQDRVAAKVLPQWPVRFVTLPTMVMGTL